MMDGQGCPVLYQLVSVYRVRGHLREEAIARNLLLDEATALAATYTGRYRVEIRTHCAIPTVVASMGDARDFTTSQEATE